MGAQELLLQIRDLIKDQIEAVITGDAASVLDGAAKHEDLLHQLEAAERDAYPADLRAIHAEIELEKAKLQSLLSAESIRVDFLLRLILGGGAQKAGGYPSAGLKSEAASRLLNRRA